MTNVATAASTTQVYRVFIKATPERIWEALIDPEFTKRYFFASRIEITPSRRVSYGPEGEIWGDGEVSVFDPPKRLVHEWRSLYDPDLAKEQASRVTWEIEPQDGGYCRLTLTHDRLEGAPQTALSVSDGGSGGWMLILSGLKTLLETGEPLIQKG